MKKVEITLPKWCEVSEVTTSVENGMLVVEYEPKKSYKPKDGDIVHIDNKCIGIFKEGCGYYAAINKKSGIIFYNIAELMIIKYEPATEQEKKILFDALAKDGKRWNPEKKCIDGLPRWRGWFLLSKVCI